MKSKEIILILFTSVFMWRCTVRSADTARQPIFDFIENKRCDASQAIPTNRDLSNWNDETTLRVLGIEPDSVAHDVYYKLADQNFLTEDNREARDTYRLYYVHRFGDEWQKILRVNRRGKPHDVVLAMVGGDSFSDEISTRFVNDSIFMKTRVLEESNHDTSRDLEIERDSVVTIYRYDRYFEMVAISKDSMHATLKKGNK